VLLALAAYILFGSCVGGRRRPPALGAADRAAPADGLPVARYGAAARPRRRRPRSQRQRTCGEPDPGRPVFGNRSASSRRRPRAGTVKGLPSRGHPVLFLTRSRP